MADCTVCMFKDACDKCISKTIAEWLEDAKQNSKAKYCDVVIIERENPEWRNIEEMENGSVEEYEDDERLAHAPCIEEDCLQDEDGIIMNEIHFLDCSSRGNDLVADHVEVWQAK